MVKSLAYKINNSTAFAKMVNSYSFNCVPQGKPDVNKGLRAKSRCGPCYSTAKDNTTIIS